MFRPTPVEVLQALDDVTLEIPSGAFVGIIGANGSGKSTLLKLLAGVLVPDVGEVHVHGSLVPLLELGIGFHPELTLRENIALYGAILGLPREGMPQRIEEVLAFAELERFRDAKLKNLSSGMIMRLAFATALRADADILLFDEVLAVGDAHFQQKCITVFEDLKRRRKTIVFVSHDLSTAQRFCDRIYWIDKGRLVMEGDPVQVASMYLAFQQRAGLPAHAPLDSDERSENRFGDGALRFVDGRFENGDGDPVTSIRAGSRVTLRLEAVAHVACPDPVVGLSIHCGSQTVYSTNTSLLGHQFGTLAPGDHIQVEFSLQMSLANGHYSVSVATATIGSAAIHDWINHLFTFIVEGSKCGDGVADLGAELSVVEPVSVLQLPQPA